GTGTLELGGSANNTLTAGNLAVAEGTLRLNKTGGAFALPITVTALNVGDNLGGADADQVTYGAGAAQQLHGNVAVTVQSTGKLDLNNNNQTFASATFTLVSGLAAAGNVTTGTGILGAGNVTLS